jgi:hypothetical protein
MGALLTEALRQRTSRDTRSKNSPHMLITKVMWRQVCEERDAAIEAQKRHLNEATEAVHDLGAKLDCALRAVEMWKAKAIRVSGEADALKQRASLLGEAVGLATTAVPDMEINPDDPVGMMRRVVETGEKAIRERDEALDDVKTLRLIVDSQSEQVTSNAKDLYAAVRAEVATKERAERAEALLREVAAIPLVVITLGSVLLAKIREALEAK